MFACVGVVKHSYGTSKLLKKNSEVKGFPLRCSLGHGENSGTNNCMLPISCIIVVPMSLIHVSVGDIIGESLQAYFQHCSLRPH